jgi:hypothetical protein
LNSLKTIVLICGCAFAANASIIQYTETVNTSGTLDGTAFTNQVVTLTLTGNTASITSGGPGIFDLIGPATVNVAGVGSDTFSDQINVADNQGINGAGFGDVTKNLAMFFTTNAAFGSYNLNGSIGPLSGTSSGNNGSSFATAGGSLLLSGPFNVDHPATFTATVPEPGTMLLALCGLAGVCLLRRRKA